MRDKAFDMADVRQWGAQFYIALGDAAGAPGDAMAALSWHKEFLRCDLATIHLRARVMDAASEMMGAGNK